MYTIKMIYTIYFVRYKFEFLITTGQVAVRAIIRKSLTLTIAKLV